MAALASKRRNSKTIEQRKAEAEALHQRLADQVAALAQSGEWVRFLEFCSSFHNYSLSNLLLVLSQNPEASRVAGFRAWQAKGRQVRKGERGLKILGFSTKKITEADENGDETDRLVKRFPILSVFDISQTDPIEGVEQIVAPVHRLEGADDRGIVTAVTEFLANLGWTVSHEAIPGETNGFTTVDGTKRVVIEESVEPAQAAKTALHEAAHVILHSDDTIGEYVSHRGLKETEAESVAYVMAGMLGLDTSAYSVGYVTTWAKGDLELVKATAANVMRAVHVLAEALMAEGEMTLAA